MAISLYNTDKICTGFVKIFNWNPELKDRKEDGGYESISITVPAINRIQWLQLVELTAGVPNTFVVHHTAEGIKLTFA